MFACVNGFSQGVARVAKLVDALCSGRSVGNHVLVRIQSRAQKPLIEDEGFFILEACKACFAKRTKIKNQSREA
jgi:hypothetical protein